MKTHIYKITIFRDGHVHEWLRFIGRVPTTEEVLETIKGELGDSCHPDKVREAEISKEIVSHIGIPTDISHSGGKTWILMGIEVGKVRVERIDAWTLDTTWKER